MNPVLPSRVETSKGVLFSDLGHEAVLLHLKDEHFFQLEERGAKIWQLLQEHGDTTVVIENLLVEYEVDEATLRQDLPELIAAMKDANLLIVS